MTARRVRVDRIFAAFLVSILILTALASMQLVVREAGTFQLLDWLISYDAGFVRRGLAGEVFLSTAHLVGISPDVLVACVQVGAYAVFFGAAHVLVRRLTPVPVALWPLLFAPFLFQFQVVNTAGGLRKEVLFFAVMAVVAAVTSSPTASTSHRSTVAAAGAWVFVPLVLVHEALFAFLPYILVLSPSRPSRRVSVGIASGAVASAVAAGLAMWRSGTLVQVRAICEEVTLVISAADAERCARSSAVSWLARDTSDGFRSVVDQMSVHGWTYAVAALFVVVGYVPGLAIAYRTTRPIQRSRIVRAVLAAWVLTIPLFLVAHDWGRFIYMHAVAMALLLLYSLGRSGSPTTNVVDACSPTGTRVRAMMAVITVLYATSWNLEPWGGALGRGWLGWVS